MNSLRLRSRPLLAGALVGVAIIGGFLSQGGPSVGATPTDAAHQIAAAATTPGQLRTYYIAADDVKWDYAPYDRNVLMDRAFNDDENVFVQGGPTRIGDTYHKAIYRAYTDATFKTLAPVPQDEQYMGLLGPVIRAEVGDKIKVVFKNNLSFPASIHAHGVLYSKSSEGAPYNDGTSASDKADDEVQPGKTYTYQWDVPERAGPGPMDGSSVLWMYHSHSDEIADTNAGLIGPMVITAKGKARPDGSPIDVDQEVFDYFSVINENESPFLQQNLDEFAQAPHEVAADDEDAFEESNLMHSINGFVYGCAGSRSPWAPRSTCTRRSGTASPW